jgi:cephalosporin-C deacetylase
MPFFDLPLAELQQYRPTVAEPADFDEFWSRTIAEARAVGGEVVVEPYESHLTAFDVFDVTFPGFAGDLIKGWFVVPRGATEPLPTVIEYNGYNGGRGFPHERLAWAAAGYAWFFMDTRGQGSLWGSGGETPDPHGSGPHSPGFMSMGIESPETYFYRRVFTDAVRAIDAVRELPQVDSAAIAVHGGSQGGGIALAAAALTPGLVAVMPDVPFLQHFERAVGINDSDPYFELVRYLAIHRDSAAQVFETLSYFDGVNFAKRSTAPAMYSVALMDPICAPSTVFASYNHYAGEAEIEVYPYNEHEGGVGYQWRRQAEWLAAVLRR